MVAKKTANKSGINLSCLLYEQPKKKLKIESVLFTSGPLTASIQSVNSIGGLKANDYWVFEAR